MNTVLKEPGETFTSSASVFNINSFSLATYKKEKDETIAFSEPMGLNLQTTLN